MPGPASHPVVKSRSRVATRRARAFALAASLATSMASAGIALAQGGAAPRSARPTVRPGSNPGPGPAAGARPRARPGARAGARGKGNKAPAASPTESSTDTAMAGAAEAPIEGRNPRAKKAYGVYLSGGLILRPVGGGGASFALGERHQVDAEAVYGAVTGVRDKSTRLHATTRYRLYPLKGSFNISLGLAYDTMTIEDGISYESGSNPNQYYKATYRYQVSQLEGELLLGNRWQTASGFFVGCDWLGIGYRLFKVSGELTTLGEEGRKPTNAKSDAEVEEVLDGDALFPSIHLLRLGVGWAF